MSNLDLSDHRTLFQFETVHFNESWPTGHNGASEPCSHMASFLHDRDLVGICRWHAGLCLPTVVSGSIPAHLVMSMTESCRWVMLCLLRPRASNKGLRPCPLHRDLSSFSESFDDVMHCRWWDSQSLCYLTLRDVVLKVFHNLFTQIGEPLPIFTSERLCLSKTDLMSINLISC